MSRRYWYTFTGGNNLQPSNYTLFTGTKGCLDGPEICAVYALYAGDTHPASIGPNLTSYIGAIPSSHVAEPRGFTPYVYAQDPN